LETTLGFCRFVMDHPAFRSGNFDTRFVENYFSPAVLQKEGSAEEAMLAALVATSFLEKSKSNHVAGEKPVVSHWKKNRV
jgi:propionyl-CoA carboxylase alpha chain